MNERLAQTVSQIQAMWQGMSAKRRLLLAGSAGVVFLLLLLLAIRLPADNNHEVLFSGLGAADAAEVLARLDDSGIPWRLVSGADGSASILVPRNLVYRTRIDLAAAGVPRQGSIGFEIFDETQLGMTDDVRRINLRRALNGELERTIRSLDVVQDARVQVALPQERLFISQQQRPTAAVMVSVRPGARLSAEQVTAIQRLVGATVEGLDPADVFVVDNRGTPLSDQLSGLSAASGTTTLEQRILIQHAVSAEYTRQVRSMLEGPFGVGRVEAMVNVELDFDRAEEIIRAFEAPNGDRGIVRSQQSFEETFEGAGSPPGGVPGVESNIPGFPSVAAPAGDSEYTRFEEIVNYEINETERRREIPPGAVKRVSVAVLIDGELSDDMKRSVASTISSALGLSPSRGDQVHVDSFPFVSSQHLMPSEVADEEIWGIPPEYALLAAGLLAALAVLYIVARRRRRLGERQGIDIMVGDDIDEGEDQIDLRHTPEEQRRRQLRNTLVSVAKEKPEDVAHLLRTWLTDD